MIGGFFLIYKADLALKAFYLFYNDSNTKIEKCNRWFQIFVTDSLVNHMWCEGTLRKKKCAEKTVSTPLN